MSEEKKTKQSAVKSEKSEAKKAATEKIRKESKSKAEKAAAPAAPPVVPQPAPAAPAARAAQPFYNPELRSDIPALRPGDEVKVFFRVVEAGKERIQVYEGTVIAIKNSGITRTITVRKNSFGIAVERIFPINSRLIQKIEVKKHTKVRRAKLYYLRKLKGKVSRLKELRQ